MKSLFQNLLIMIGVLIIFAMLLTVTYLRILRSRLRNGLTVPDWYYTFNDLLYLLTIPFVIIVGFIALWKMVQIGRPKNLPNSTVLTSAAIGISDTENSTLEKLSHYRKDSGAYPFGLSYISQNGHLDGYINRYILTLGFIIVMILFEFTRQLLFPPSLNNWIDNHHTFLLTIVLAISAIVWLYDSVFSKLHIVTEPKKALTPKIKLMAKRLLLVVFLGATMLSFSIYDPVANRWIFEQLSLNTMLSIAIIGLLASLIFRR